MDDLEAYGRMFAVEMNGETEAQSALHSLEGYPRDARARTARSITTFCRCERMITTRPTGNPQALENGSGSDIRNQHRRSKRVLLRRSAENGDVMRLAQEASNIRACIFPCRSSCCWRRAWPASAVSGAPADGAVGAAIGG
ncbi:MAG: hypothetical protein ACLUI3_16925 [Christensenellales bacterium]